MAAGRGGYPEKAVLVRLGIVGPGHRCGRSGTQGAGVVVAAHLAIPIVHGKPVNAGGVELSQSRFHPVAIASVGNLVSLGARHAQLSGCPSQPHSKPRTVERGDNLTPRQDAKSALDPDP